MADERSDPSSRFPVSRTRVAARMGLGLVALLVSLWGLVSWVEAEKEVRWLCSIATSGKSRAEVERVFSTGNFLRTAEITVDGGAALLVTARANLGLSRCTVGLADGVVVAPVYEERLRAGHLLGVMALLGLGWLVVLQGRLAFGAPLGHLAWGGRYKQLPTRLRVASGLSSVVLAFGAVCVVEQAGLAAPLTLIGLPDVAETGVGVLTLIMLLSFFANLASPSRVERRTGAPLAFLLFCAGVVLILGV